MFSLLKKLLEARAKVAKRTAKFFESGEAVTHFIYGIAVFTESHGELTIYSGSAFCLGCVAVVAALVGKGE